MRKRWRFDSIVSKGNRFGSLVRLSGRSQWVDATLARNLLAGVSSAKVVIATYAKQNVPVIRLAFWAGDDCLQWAAVVT